MSISCTHMKHMVSEWSACIGSHCCGSNIVNLKQTNIKAAWFSGRKQGRYLTGVASIPGHVKRFHILEIFL